MEDGSLDIAGSSPVVGEIAQLLDQCSSDELNNILAAIQGGEDPLGLAQSNVQQGAQLSPMPIPPPPPPFTPGVDPVTMANGAEVLFCDAQAGNAAGRERQPVPPSAPPPGNGRRPVAANLKRAEEQPQPQHVTVDDVKALLDEHSNKVLQEVRNIVAPGIQNQALSLPSPPTAGADGAQNQLEFVDMDTLTSVLVDRDREVRDLEAKLAELQQELGMKDKYVADLGTELDVAVREVRHKQLDLEFQQLKLEERVRSNAELEQAQNMLTQRVEEAGLTARHAAIEVEMCRSTPRSVRVQGSLPWTLRKNRIA